MNVAEDEILSSEQVIAFGEHRKGYPLHLVPKSQRLLLILLLIAELRSLLLRQSHCSSIWTIV